MTEKSEIAGRIKAIRKELKLTQAEFADKLKLSTSSISEMEAGNYKPTYQFFYHVGKELGVNLYYLLYGEGEMISDGIRITDYFSLDNLVVDKGEFIKMLEYCNLSPIVQYSMMGQFRRILQADGETIQQEIEKNRAKDSR